MDLANITIHKMNERECGCYNLEHMDNSDMEYVIRIHCVSHQILHYQIDRLNRIAESITTDVNGLRDMLPECEMLGRVIDGNVDEYTIKMDCEFVKSRSRGVEFRIESYKLNEL